MEIKDLQSYQQVITYLNEKNRPKHLLLGNGFSIAYDSDIFSYNALSTFIDKIDNPLLQKLFSIVNTKNFEQIMQQLDNFAEIAKIFSSDIALVDKIKTASTTLKDSLIQAVKQLHPEHVFIIPEKDSINCFQFLDNFLSKKGKIFSTNYDLLLYWIIMRNNSISGIDGFGRDRENADEYVAEELVEYSELRWGKYKKEQSIFYLHGTLPIFDTGIEIIKEEYDTQHFLLKKIEGRMENRDYPIFVTAGNAKEKLNHIMHNKYLSFCYDDFCSIEGSLVTFGFNFGDSDSHILDAINKAAHHGRASGNKLYSIYIGVYDNSGLDHIESIRSKFKCKVNLYNAETAHIWR